MVLKTDYKCALPRWSAPFIQTLPSAQRVLSLVWWKKAWSRKQYQYQKWMSEQMSVLALFAFVCLYSRASVKCIVSSWLFRINDEAPNNLNRNPSYTCFPYNNFHFHLFWKGQRTGNSLRSSLSDFTAPELDRCSTITTTHFHPPTGYWVCGWESAYHY